MAHLRWTDRPTGERPVLIAAFEGWNDAGDAATTAIEHLSGLWQAEPFADIDPEDFYDFTATRPQVRLDAQHRRSIDWPANRFAFADPSDSGGVVLLRGVEPQLRWRTFCSQVLHVASLLECRMVLTLGALLAEVADTRPAPVFGHAYDDTVTQALGLVPSHYEGPTGIVGVLHTECSKMGLDSAALWVAVPSYVPTAPSAKAARALSTRAGELIGVEVDGSELDADAAAYESQISAIVGEDDATVDYVAHLEELYDRDAMAVQSADDMVAEVERFLREQH